MALIKKNFWQDKDIELAIGTLLRAGVLLASATVLIGAAVYLFRNGQDIPSYHTFATDTHTLSSVRLIINGLRKGEGRAIIQLGILFLIATPVVRIIFSAFGFMKEKDYLYVLITLIVFCIIISSMFSGVKG